MDRIFTVGITGGSGSGKTYFLNKLAASFDAGEICLLSQDHYYKPRQEQQKDSNGITNFDLPEAILLDKFAADIRRIKLGETIRLEEYTYNNPKAKATTLEFKPSPILVIEGLFVQFHPAVEAQLDLKIFIEAKDHVKLSRRIRRDNEERGYDLDDVLYRYENHVMPVYEKLIAPLQHKADLVIPNNSNFDRALDVVICYLKGRVHS